MIWNTYALPIIVYPAMAGVVSKQAVAAARAHLADLVGFSGWAPTALIPALWEELGISPAPRDPKSELESQLIATAARWLGSDGLILPTACRLAQVAQRILVRLLAPAEGAAREQQLKLHRQLHSAAKPNAIGNTVRRLATQMAHADRVDEWLEKRLGPARHPNLDREEIRAWQRSQGPASVKLGSLRMLAGLVPDARRTRFWTDAAAAIIPPRTCGHPSCSDPATVFRGG